MSDFATCKPYTAYYIASKVFDCSEYMLYAASAFRYCFIPLFLPFCQFLLSLNASLNNAGFYAFFSYFLADAFTEISRICQQLCRLSSSIL